EYLTEYQHHVHCPVKVNWQFQPEEMELSPLQEVQLLRIVQEALTNVRKHAEATEIVLDFVTRGGDLEIQVKDNGKGFNPLAITRGEWPHLGLQTMQERAAAIGGVFEIDSAPGKGTTVRVRVPRAVHHRTAGGRR
ncbi:MAG: sensor histidine kinase, partial [Dehalococcoidia bacterium]